VGNNVLRLDLDSVENNQGQEEKKFYDIQKNDIEDIYRVFIEEELVRI
jgi:hypothetical protein